MNQPRNIDQLFQQPAFQNLDPKKLALLKKMIKDLDSKTDEEKMQYILKFGSKMQQYGASFSSEERNAMIEAIKTTLSPGQRKQFEMMQKMMEMMSKK